MQERMFASEFPLLLQPLGEHYATLDTLLDACRIDACTTYDNGARERKF